MEYLQPFKDVPIESKARYINKSLQFLALRPDLLKSVETDQQLINRVELFAESLYKYDPKLKLC